MTQKIDGNIDDIMEFAKAYNDLGWATQDQLNEMINNDLGLTGDGELDLNSNALREIKKRLGGYSDELDIVINKFTGCVNGKTENEQGNNDK